MATLELWLQNSLSNMFSISAAELLLGKRGSNNRINKPLITATKGGRVSLNRAFRAKYFPFHNCLWYQVLGVGDEKFLILTEVPNSYYYVVKRIKGTFSASSPQFCEMYGEKGKHVRYHPEHVESDMDGSKVFRLINIK